MTTPGAVLVNAPIEVRNDAASPAMHDSQIAGGAHAVLDVAERDAIPLWLLKPGTIVSYPDGTTEHRNATNDGWVDGSGGGGGGIAPTTEWVPFELAPDVYALIVSAAAPPTQPPVVRWVATPDFATATMVVAIINEKTLDGVEVRCELHNPLVVPIDLDLLHFDGNRVGDVFPRTLEPNATILIEVRATAGDGTSSAGGFDALVTGTATITVLRSAGGVQTVNGIAPVAGDVTLSAGDVGADPSGTADDKVQTHSAFTSAVHGITAQGAQLTTATTAAQQRTALGLAAVAATGSASDLATGTLPAARLPALTGAVTTTAGNVATTLANGAVTNAKMASMAASTLKGAIAAGAPVDLTVAQARTLLGMKGAALLDVGTTAGTVAAGDDGRIIAAGVAAARLGVEVIGSDTFDVSFTDPVQQVRDATGAVTVTGLTGLAPGLSVSVVIRNTTVGAIAVTVVPSVHSLNDSPLTFSLPAGKVARLSFGSVGTLVADVDYACGVES